MGGAESVVRNVDKRTSRREHRAHFEAAVDRFRAAPFAAPPRPAGNGGEGDDDRFVRVCVRKRPIFPHELSQGEFDVVTCLPGRVVVHDARMHPDMRHMFMNHHDFAFDEAFSEKVDNDEVYARTARELVESTLEGRCCTVMMYGQTGSGKTYTMSAVYERVAQDLFAGCEGRLVTASFVELSGDKCFDMLHAGEPCNLTQAGDGSVHPFPCVEVQVKDPSELLALINLAAKLRATAATGVHDQSSRSHAVCRIFVEGPAGSGPAAPEGNLTLVDLAGSEHRVDSSEHNPERRKEGAKINASLAALKECIRAASSGAKFVAFRQNRLTQILRGCFSRLDRHQTVVIATVSPSSKDTEHSMNTLRHACIMDGQGEQKSGTSAIAGGVVTKETLGEIDVTKLAREKRAAAKANAGQPDEWGKPQAPPAHQLKQSNTAARAGLDRKAMRALPQRIQEALVAARAEWGSDRQRARIGRAGVMPQAPPSPSPPPAAKAAAAAPAKPEEEARPSAARALGNDALTAAVEDAGADGEKAFELFALFVRHGRHAHDWRKNDLRLINNCIVPALFGEGESIDWRSPPCALDELDLLLQAPQSECEEVVAALRAGDPAAQQPQRPQQRRAAAPAAAAAAAAAPPSTASSSSSAPARPPRPPTGEAASSRTAAGAAGGAQRGSGYPAAAADDDDGGGGDAAPPPRRRSSAGAVPKAKASGGGAAGGGSSPAAAEERRRSGAGAGQAAAPAAARRPPSARSESPGLGDSPKHGQRGSPAPSSAASSSRSSVSHRDAVRARREAMERARKETLEKALEGKKEQPTGRDTEIESLEQQINSGSCSAAAAVGLKKRLAALKAQAVREQRAAEQKARAAAAAQEAPRQEPPPPRVEASSQQPPRSHGASPAAASCPAQERGQPGTPQAREQEDDYWPEPAVPPPRAASRAGQQSPAAAAAAAAAAADWNRTMPHQGSPCGMDWAESAFGANGPPGRRGGLAVGAAAAPWGNAFSDD